MLIDLSLAIAHHVLVFGLVIMLAMQLGLLQGGRIEPARLAGLDAGYGMTSLMIIAIGVARVIWGAKGWAYYEANPWFWAKMAAFLAIGLLSIGPTRTFLRWRKAARADAAWAAPAAEVARVQAWVRIELLLVFSVVVFAATMARLA